MAVTHTNVLATTDAGSLKCVSTWTTCVTVPSSVLTKMTSWRVLHRLPVLVCVFVKGSPLSALLHFSSSNINKSVTLKEVIQK